MSEYKIRSEPTQVVVERRSVVKSGRTAGQESWSPVSYHLTVAHAARWLLDRVLREETKERQGWSEVIASVERAHVRVQGMLK